MQLLYMVCIIMLCCLNVRNAIFASTDMVWRGMEQRILSIEIRAVSKAVDRYLGESMPLSAKGTTGGNAHIIMFLARNRDREIYQHTIEQKFCITRSTASRVLALMEKKGLIARESVAHDARCKRIVLTDKADAIVADVEGRHYPAAAARAVPVSFAKSLRLGLASVGRLLAVNLIAVPIYIPLLFTAIGVPLLAFAINAALLGRDLEAMVLARHPDRPRLTRGARWLP